MKLQYEKRTHISEQNYKFITKIRDSYGENLFRMAISHLFSNGYGFFDKLTAEDIEQSYQKLVIKEKTEKENGGTSFMSPEFVRDLNLCALQLNKINHILLLKYITNYIFYSIN